MFGSCKRICKRAAPTRPGAGPLALLAADPEPPDAALRAHAGLRPRCGQVRWMPVDEQAGLRKYRHARAGRRTGQRPPGAGAACWDLADTGWAAVAGPDNGPDPAIYRQDLFRRDLTANTAVACLATGHQALPTATPSRRSRRQWLRPAQRQALSSVPPGMARARQPPIAHRCGQGRACPTGHQRSG